MLSTNFLILSTRIVSVVAMGGQATTLHPAVVACNAVAALYPAQVIKPSSSEFAIAQDSFWDARQQERAPVCFFQPTNAAQVKAALIEVVRAKSHFGIKGGGHSASKGSCNKGYYVQR
ncbi:FAD-binding PCMH-type domain-containing protein [Fusarium sp. LHS14.1]|nr:FAD-binding PCMH-type domain-containing protein [Fusarium sp. LHS14.1]